MPPPRGEPWGETANRHPIPLWLDRRSGAVIKLGEVVMIFDLHRQGLTVSAIARELERWCSRPDIRVREAPATADKPIHRHNGACPGGPTPGCEGWSTRPDVATQIPRWAPRAIGPGPIVAGPQTTNPGVGSSNLSGRARSPINVSTCCAIYVRYPCPPLRFVSKPRPATKHRSILPSSRWSSPTSRW